MPDNYPFLPGPINTTPVRPQLIQAPAGNPVKLFIWLGGGLIFAIIVFSYLALAVMAAGDDPHWRSIAQGVPGCAVLAEHMPHLHLAGGSLFYDPKQPQPYAISADERFDTSDAAYTAWAKKFGRTRGWIEKNAGSSNDYSKMEECLLIASGDYRPGDPNKIIQDTRAANEKTDADKQAHFKQYVDDRVADAQKRDNDLYAVYQNKMQHAHSIDEQERLAREYTDQAKSNVDDAAHDMTDQMHDDMNSSINEQAARARKAQAAYERSARR